MKNPQPSLQTSFPPLFLSRPSVLRMRQGLYKAGFLGAGLLAVCAGFGVDTASATTFNITGSSTSAQSLASGETGTVASTGSLSVSGSTVAVTITGSNATLTNLGSIKQTGTGRVIRDNTGVQNLIVNNGSSTNSSALMQAQDADVFQMNVPASSVTLNNYGTMTSLNSPTAGGNQAVDFSAITNGSNIVNNFATGVLQATEADAVRPGVNGVVNNYGSILSTTTSGSSSDGVDAQNDTGVTVNNFAGGSITGGRHGITGGALNNSVLFTTTVNNAGTIKGSNGSGINLDGFNANQTATIVNSGSIIGNGVTGDGDGIDVDGVVNINNTGTIKSLNSVGTTTPGQSEGITVGGGTIVNSGTIEGDVAAGNTNAVGRGITFAGIDTSGTAEPIYANSSVTNTGLIKGQSDSAIAVDGGASGFTVTVNNNAGGTLQGGGTSNAAVRLGADNDTINNAGTIDGSSSGKAIDMGAGNNTLHVTGGSILGSINGGSGGSNAMTISPGAGSSFSYGGSISNFNSVEVQSGAVTLSGASNYIGSTIISGGSLTLSGANRISASSALVLNGGSLVLANAGGANGETFASLGLTNSSIIDLGASSLSFNALGSIVAGKTLSLLDYFASTSGGYAFRLLGDYTANSSFLALLGETTINGQTVAYSFDGTYTDVTPVPVPGALGLMLSGMGLLGGLARRRRGA